MNIPTDKIEMFLSAYTKTVSIENGIERADGKEMNIADMLADDTTLVSANVEYESLKDDIQNVISTLKEREREVVKMRYGLDESERFTLEEIGNLYGVTKECIRQTELRALKKMKISGGAILSSYFSCLFNQLSRNKNYGFLIFKFSIFNIQCLFLRQFRYPSSVLRA